MDLLLKEVELFPAACSLSLVSDNPTAALLPENVGKAKSRAICTWAYRRYFRTLSTGVVRVGIVQATSLFRLFSVLVFAALAFGSVSRVLLASLYVFAMASDLLDGYLARKLHVTSYFGRVMDLVADKSLAVVSLLYAAERGMDLLPIALIATRDIVMIGMRLVIVDGRQLLPTNRTFGGLIALLLGANTILLLNSDAGNVLRISNYMCWVLAMVVTINLLARVYTSADRIKLALAEHISSIPENVEPATRCNCTCGRSTDLDNAATVNE
jgi:phosphatidylglycerophosphate synthase